MSELKVTVRDKIATADGQTVVCGNSDYTVCFDLDAEWGSYETKTMRVVYHDRTYTDVVFTGFEAPLPVVTNQSAIRVGLFAGDLHTSSPAYFPCVLSILCGLGTPVDPTPDVYGQIMEKLNKLGEVEIDNKTIIKNADGKLCTSVGGADLGTESIAWDGSTEGLVSISLAGYYPYYKVSDKTPSMSSDMSITAHMVEDGEEDPGTAKGAATVWDDYSTETIKFLISDAIDVGLPFAIVAFSDNAEISELELTIPEKGVYFIGVNFEGVSLTTQELDVEYVQKIDSKFLDLEEVYSAIDNVPKVERTSQLTNDSGFLTLNTLPKYGGATS